MTSTPAQFASSPANSLQEKLLTYVWQKRILLVVASSENDENFKRQVSLLNGNEMGIQDRDLEILYLPPNKIKQKDKEYLTETFKIKYSAFYSILIGKDGTEKLRSDKPLTVKQLFEIIDAMPMRRKEMKEKKIL